MPKPQRKPKQAGLDWFSSDLIEILPAAVYVCNIDAVVVAYNRRATELWGRAPKIGDTDLKFCGSHKLFRPDGTFLPHAETPMEMVLRTGKPARDQEVIIEQPDGTRLTALVNIAPIFDDRGTLIGAVNCFQDLSAHQKTETEKVKSREELHQAQKIQSLGQLTGGIAHDFNNLIGEITGSLDLVRRRLEVGRTDGIDGFVAAAAKAAERAGVLTHRLLAFARQQSLDIRPMDVNDLVAGMGDMLRRTLGENVAFETVLKRDLWWALTDANQLDSVLVNLVVNARDAMPDGGRLTVETTNMPLDAAYASTHGDVEPGDYVMIAVSDTGCGIPASVIAKVFDPFFTTKPIGQGTGLGLSMVHGFAKQSGGHVRIHSQVGQGSSIKLYLPRAPRDAEQLAEPVVEATPRGSGEMILVVDDNDALRSVMTEVVRELGYRHLEAHNADTAIPLLLSDQPIDLLVTDVGLPNMNGRQLAEIARQHRPGLKVLFVTGYAQNATLRGEFLAPGMEMLTKPFTFSSLGAKIRALIES